MSSKIPSLDLFNITPKNEKIMFAGTMNAMAESPSQSKFEFVNVTPASEAERERNQRVVRSAAMKTFRRQQQIEKQQTEGRKKGEKKKRPQIAPAHVKELSFRNVDPGARNAYPADINFYSMQHNARSPSRSTSSGSSDNGLEDWGFNDVRQSVPSASVHTQDFLLKSPPSPLSDGHVDPFKVYSVDLTGPRVKEIIHHCKSTRP